MNSRKGKSVDVTLRRKNIIKGILLPTCSTFSPYPNINGENIYFYNNFDRNQKAKFKNGKAIFNREQVNHFLGKLIRTITKTGKNKKISRC
jgi:hypothetical protein